jgi:tetraacyldisaccharide 4'-kinase
MPVDEINGRPVVAVAGIGNPARFFDTLRSLGARVTERALPDHHRFRPQDLECDASEWLVMTAKDAVKCDDLAPENAWVLEVEARLPDPFSEVFLSAVKTVKEK